MSLIIASCQPEEIIAEPEAAMAVVRAACLEARAANAAIICFPECFLQGYLVETHHVTQHAIRLDSDEFMAVMGSLDIEGLTIVLGLIERLDDRFYNSAAVLHDGRLLGVYRKSHLTDGESKVFTRGTEHPVFDLEGITFGINICYDLNFPECAEQAASQGASLLVCPCNNMLRHGPAEVWKEKHNAIRAERCRETAMSLVSSDVTGERDDRIAWGPTAVISSTGEVIEQLPLGQAGLLFHTLSS